jgi:hypothetical protein
MLAKLNDEQMQQPDVQGSWSVKDIIAHLTIWEQRGTQWIRSLAQEEEPEIPLPSYTWDDVDQLNIETYEENREKPPKEVLAEFEKSFACLLEQVQSLDEEDLERSFEAYWADGEQRTLRDIVTWRYLHYRSHGKYIEDWLKGLEGKPES